MPRNKIAFADVWTLKVEIDKYFVQLEPCCVSKERIYEAHQENGDTVTPSPALTAFNTFHRTCCFPRDIRERGGTQNLAGDRTCVEICEIFPPGEA